MIGIGKTWKGISGAKSQAPTSTIPRDVLSRKISFDGRLPDLGSIEPSETREAPRFLPAKTTTVLTTTGGKRLTARIINMSRTGVAVEADVTDLRADDITMVGSYPVTHGRRLARGLVLVFRTPLKQEECGPSIVL